MQILLVNALPQINIHYKIKAIVFEFLVLQGNTILFLLPKVHRTQVTQTIFWRKSLKSSGLCNMTQEGVA